MKDTFLAEQLGESCRTKSKRHACVLWPVVLPVKSYQWI